MRWIVEALKDTEARLARRYVLPAGWCGPSKQVRVALGKSGKTIYTVARVAQAADMLLDLKSLILHSRLPPHAEPDPIRQSDICSVSFG